MARVAFKQAMRDTMAAFDAQGTPVKSALVHRDGSVELLTTEAPSGLADADEGDWVDLAGQTDAARA